MTKGKIEVIEKDSVVVKFAGDCGDGMQLSGTLFSDTSAMSGNDLSTFPDYPAEIRAPHNTVAGVSGYQVHIGKEIHTIGDKCDVLVAMNPASLKANLHVVKMGGTIIVDVDTFVPKAFEKAGCNVNPLEDASLSSYNVIKAPISSAAKQIALDNGLELRDADRSKNMYALGMVAFIFDRDLTLLSNQIAAKFKKNVKISDVNIAVLKAGYIYAESIEAVESRFHIPTAKLEKGRYRNISGNIATAWGLLAASERSGRPLFLGSYPITPATDILVELAKHKSLNARVMQCEDEIAGICSSIGASYAGSMAVTSTSGPGLSLKSEAIGLAVMTELPVVIVDVQRGGPSTGLPTKSEQADLLQVLYGRNGACPCIVVAATSPSDCFESAYMAAKLSMEHMTPTILMTDGYIGQGSELFRIPKVADMPSITPPIAEKNDPNYKPYRRDDKTLARKWAIPGTQGLEHRVGGLEKSDVFGAVSTDPNNHEKMVYFRNEKVQRVADYLPNQEVIGDESGDLLVVSWGGTKGQTYVAVKELQKQGKKVSLAHFKYIMPLPKNTADIFAKFKKIVVCELNDGQFADYLRIVYPKFVYHKYNKIKGIPFTTVELVNAFNQYLKEE
ncbi:MAG: 2-oxoglutarate oxidoreductase subunit KorA [Bacteroidetes bacterium ADurb.Bin234]|jgi:2-oxoglutarate ferredoxin oxidoreductase subunit alpha|nr:MAG: 2-oxoglutarate oxidoreductase subunit KorA [Bacteroidetes bacterium ADurb.Bin234]